ncbi:MAG: lytic transglycosylase domain-containing protein [Pseudomonadota bacterium]|nr:lytic transglycosylase domain-containing protein [Pseudomonadota bacterium]
MQRRNVQALPLVTALALLFAALPCRGDIRTCKGADGVRHITNIPNDPLCQRTRARPLKVRKVPVKRTPGIYVLTDEHGVRRYTNLPDDPRYEMLIPLPDQPPQSPAAGGRRPFAVNESNRRRLAGDIDRIAGEFSLDPALLHAVISAESAFNPVAVSPKGAMGLMQLMPATARRFGVADPYDPVANIVGGARYLRWLLDQFQQLTLALAAYNAGENAVIRHGNAIPPFQETQTYVARVLKFYDHYRLPQ